MTMSGSFRGNEDEDFFAVFDGHGGQCVSEFCAIHSPRVIEEALYEHPAVVEAVVIGVPDAHRGQAPKAFVVLSEPGSVTGADLRDFLRDKISKIELPREVEIRDSLPKTLIGKLSKKELVEEEMAKAAR